MNYFTCELEDQADRGKPAVKASVLGHPNNLCVRLEGYGDCYSADGHGAPVLIEVLDGKARVIVWGDINQEDPTHVIDLSGALETARTPEPEPIPMPPLPLPDKWGHYRLPDGCTIYPAADGCDNGMAIPGLGARAGDADSPRFKGKWRATWKNDVPLRGSDGDDECLSEFPSPEAAYLCIWRGGEGRPSP